MALKSNSSRGLQRQVDLTTAVCQERLLATHVRHVIALVDLVSDQLPFDAALDIYARVLKLSPEQARNVGSRVLAVIGRRNGLPEVEDHEVGLLEDEPEDREQVDRSATGSRFDLVFGRVRRRIRGRVQEDLRNRINLAAARAEDALFHTHVENGLIFARALQDEMPLHEAVELYLELMAIPDGVSDVIFNRALRTVADEVLPPINQTRAPKREDDGRSLAESAPAAATGSPAAAPSV
ncbi:MAG TPA: hypothetical protein VFE05_23120 [Longimicrobiaceae bacterium]|nr:hypothetical protein [Longimicrobiaceae bacterium]